MSERARTVTWMLGGQSSVYLLDDRLEVGTTDPMFSETLARVAYRDARSLVAWTSSRRAHLWLGVLVGVIALVLLLAALAASDQGATIALAFVAILIGLGALPLIWMGRPHGITRFRLEGTRGKVEGVLSGSRKKRAALLAEIEERIRARQSATA